MRLRFNKNASIQLENSEYFITTNALKQINPSSWFTNKQDIHIEIGSGRGEFIVNKALQNKEINYIAIEKNITALAKILNKLQDIQLTNLKIINYDAKKLNQLFQQHTIAKIYLNFSDPWPKSRHAKRRLLHPEFLNVYFDLLIDCSKHIEFKTDNDGLFHYTYYDVIKAFPEHYKLIYHTTDLYSHLNDENNLANIPTEYEKKFHSLGKNIYKIVFTIKQKIEKNF